MNIISTLNLGTSLLGFIVAFMLIFAPSQNRQVNRFLGMAFLVMAYRSLTNYSIHEHLIDNTFLMGSLSFAYYLLPPALFLYFRSLMKDEQSLRKTDWIHFLVPLGAIVLLVYYVLAGYLEFGYLRLPREQNVFNELRYYPLYVLPKYHMYCLFASSIIYLSWSWKLFFQKLRKKPEEHVQVKKVRLWVLSLLVTCTILLVIVFYHVSLLLVFKVNLNNAVNPDIFRSMILVFVFTRVLFKPELLFGIPRISSGLPVIDYIPVEVYEQVITAHEIKEPARKIAEDMMTDTDFYFDHFGWIHMQHLEDGTNSELANASAIIIEKDKVIDYIQRINQYLSTAPYKDPDFDMKTISNELQCPLYHVEYIFRYYNQYTFVELRNVLRVQYVLQYFENGLSQDYTMESIGIKAGFNSRSSFFRIFKTVTGKTPKQVLEERLA